VRRQTFKNIGIFQATMQGEVIKGATFTMPLNAVCARGFFLIPAGFFW
jgi:hypothetical protein